MRPRHFGLFGSCVFIFNLAAANAAVPAKPFEKKPVVFVTKAVVPLGSQVGARAVLR